MSITTTARTHLIEDSLWLNQAGESWPHIAERLSVKITTIYRTYLRHNIPFPDALRAEATRERNNR